MLPSELLVAPGQDAMIRAFAEKLARSLAFPRRLPKRVGALKLFVSPDAALKHFVPGKRGFDPVLLDAAREVVKDGMVVWDVGANIGVFSFAALGCGTGVRVLAIEPDLWLAGLIGRSKQLRENRELDLEILPAAVSEGVAIEKLLIAQRGRASNALQHAGGRSQMGGVRAATSVVTVTLDFLLRYFEQPDVVKIDIEGAEVMALKGATRLLREARPILIIEVGQACSRDVAAILADNGYLIHDLAMRAEQRRPLLHCPFNTLAIPRQSLDTVEAV